MIPTTTATLWLPSSGTPRLLQASSWTPTTPLVVVDPGRTPTRKTAVYNGKPWAAHKPFSGEDWFAQKILRQKDEESWTAMPTEPEIIGFPIG